ncbi:sigma 54-interacting transcriptional regulator [Clostridium sp. MB40-C1]|uniref:sigma-54-dependent transcriptional regulator n=1 Tax=Clostridium sp. MB40-C1 TaxID=3070996 RepID=UPI0027E20930|nr:sigma-54-dependent transcriptional regulator [Clostridium sp. MB40-C1]WMJ81734.1 sigma 54-interacting transcriptional regulator [Clostridium sp. MB40-C1]
MKRIDTVYEELKKNCIRNFREEGNVIGFSTQNLAERLNIHRSNVSCDLNKLYKMGRVIKIQGKPVLYKIKDKELSEAYFEDINTDVFDNIIGSNLSLKNSVQQARAAIMYPPKGLHTIILGETGTGKSMFAESMYNYAKHIGKIKDNAPFIIFNCSDYANNPQLLMSQLFGVKKGAYTGANKDKSGLIEKANDGILFLDEVHRLPPEGQEMLFYIIDKGVYRKLGEVDIQHKANILIICATTENVESVLLKTFIRRIPMIIRLPSLKDRTIEERYSLISNFFKEEARCIKSDIKVTANALKALLLYDCPNNIGQLKSDIKLCCAKAFLESMLKKSKDICVQSEDLQKYIIQGLLLYKSCREEIDKFVNIDITKFQVENKDSSENKDIKVYNFYEYLEDKRKSLEIKGINEKDIKLIMSLDIDTYFKKYILNIDEKHLDKIYKVVDKKIVDIVDKFLNYCEEKMYKKFEAKILYGLSMHVASSIERIRGGKEIKNHQLEYIKKNYVEEFKYAHLLKEKIEESFNIKVPEDEIGFICMFLCLNKETIESDGKVAILVAMHGESSATSIVDVANRLLEENYAVGYNMPLEQKPEDALENLINISKKINKGKGILLLVDMGSLVFFGDLIYERTKIPVKTIEMICTPMVLEGTRKALVNASLEEVYEACLNLSPYIGRIYRENFDFNHKLKKDVIITACITGEGTAVKLKSIIEHKLNTKNRDVDVLCIDILSKNKFNKDIEKIKEDKNVIAVISAIKPIDDSILYISTSDIFNEEKILILDERMNMLKTISNMKSVIEENINIDSSKYIESFKKFYMYLLSEEVRLDENLVVGLILHIGCVLERVLSNKKMKHLNTNIQIPSGYEENIKLIKNAVLPIERKFSVSMTMEEYINITKIIYSI